MSDAAPLLIRYRDRRLLAPGHGITCPQELQAELITNGFIADSNTVTDGQCGLHAFLISLTSARHQWPTLSQLAVCKKLATIRPLQSKLDHLRQLAVAWLTREANTILWDDMSVRAFVQNSMGDEIASFGDYLAKMAQRTYWVDLSILHALGVLFKVDVIIFQQGSDISFVGMSLRGLSSSASVPLVPVALHNDRHYWGLTSSYAPADVCGNSDADASADVRGNSDADAHANAPDQSKDSAYDDFCASHVEVVVHSLPSEDVQRELNLCLALRVWDPFAVPQQELLDCMTAIKGPLADATTCTVRQQAMEDLLYESVNFDNIPERLRYHGACRWRLSSRRQAVDESSRQNFVNEYLQVTSKISLHTVSKDLQISCAKNKQPCDCLDSFRSNPDVVRNWRVLWHCLPPYQRRELLLRMHHEDLAGFRRAYPNKSTKSWRVTYKFLGQKVCLRGFQALTHIGSSSLTAMRTGALNGQLSSLSRHEMGWDQLIKMTNKPKLYLDARMWLENYGSTVPEESPTSLVCKLPPGRKHFYYCTYMHDRESADRAYASEAVFLLAWRVDVNWLILQKLNPRQQMQCGVCCFLCHQIDSTRRGDATLHLLKSRLGIHFKFQAAQRLAQDRVEEKCAQSQGDLWMMKIDRMDQTKTILPMIWPLSHTPLFKLGERLVTSIIGSKWTGTGTNIHWLMRSNFADFPHDGNTQCSAILDNLHDVALAAGRLPKEFIVGADNTVKETKNNCFLHFCIWLLCVLDGCSLWSIVFMSLIAGHTHDALDAFYALLRAALAGQSYMTLADMWQIVITALKHDRGYIKFAHVCRTWDFTQMGKDADLPRIHGNDLPRIHVFNVFRHTTGIWIKWKQFMTDDTWSRPVLLVGRRRMKSIASMLPANVQPNFKANAEMMSWSQKLEETLVDQLPSRPAIKDGIEWFRAVINRTLPEYNGNHSPSLTKIMTDLVSIDHQAYAAPCSLVAADSGFLADIFVQHFPGADVPTVPVDTALRIVGAWEPPPPPRCILDDALVICKPAGASMSGMKLLFNLGRVISCPTERSPNLIVQWLVPPLGPVVDHKPGHKRTIPDLFGAWVPLDDITMKAAVMLEMPDCILSPSDVLIPNILLSADGTIPYCILDELRSQHDIDVSGLQVSRTQKGNLYRSHVLSRAYC